MERSGSVSDLARNVCAAETDVLKLVVGKGSQLCTNAADPEPFLNEREEGHVRNSCKSVNPFAPAHRLSAK